MGSEDLFKKRRIAREKRKYAFKTPRANSYLIVTEGECTEPNYFKGLKKKIEDSIGGNVDVVGAPKIEIYGEGKSTTRLIETTEWIINRANVIYQNIWVIFDKDDFRDFNGAVEQGTAKGYNIGWSNQSFEYWIFLHFKYSDSNLHRHEWNRKLDAMFKEYGLRQDGYDKNIENIYDLLDSFGGVKTAIANAKRRMEKFNLDGIKPSEYAPGTTVYLLTEELIKYLE